MGYVLFMTSPTSIDFIVVERFLQTLISASCVDQICRTHKVKARQGIYNLAVVVWLMIYQRLNGKRTLSSAVQFLAREAVHWQPGPLHKPMREGGISSRTGGYCRARLKMPKLVATDVCDHIFDQLQAIMREQLPDV